MHAPMWPIILLVLMHFSHYFVLGEVIKVDEKASTISNQTIQEITKKVDEIANTLLTNSSATNSGYILNNLENKLLNASGHLGPRGKKYVKLIMERINLKVFNETKDKQTTIEENAAKLDVNENSDQQELITEIYSKIESLIKNELIHFNTSENKEIKFIESVSLKQNEILINDLNTNNSRRMVEHKSDFRSHHDSKADLVDNNDLVKLNQNANHINKFRTLNERKTPPVCRNFINRTCEDIKNMNRLKCRYEQSYITLDKLCDGNPDCPFESDEKNCYAQVMEKLLYVKQVEANIEPSILYSKCFKFDTGSNVLTNQAKTLRDVLEKELNSEKKFNYLNSSFHEANNFDENDQMKVELEVDPINEELEAKRKGMANSIALVISSLALALDGALCSNKLDYLNTRRSNDFFDIDIGKEFKKTFSPPEGCKCKKEFCNNCTHYCKRLCTQKFGLTNWNCESVNGNSTVSLNMLCDGKLDCFDESDEEGCDKGTGYAKFEANDMYNKILNMLQLKASKQSQPIHKKFLLLSDSIMRLQELTTGTAPKLITIKKLRDKCYSMLRDIYSDFIKLTDIGKESEDEYLFLLSINRDLGTALKFSNTGNAKIMDNECDCRNGTCSSSACSKICAKACAFEPKLTRYYCFGKSNKSVSIEKICDGIQDCSNGYDEFNCKKDEICRRHHLVVLRHSLQRVGENLKGTAVGENLSSWKLKVISTLKVLEKTKRPTPQALKNVVEGILKDLAVSYGSVEKYRRSTADYVLKVFMNISQIILESIKSCGK